MDETATMTVPPPLPAKTQARDVSQAARQTVSIRTVSPSVPTSLASGPGATVFVGVSAPTIDSATTCGSRIPEVQLANDDYEERSGVVETSRQQQHQQQRWQQSQHHNHSHHHHHHSHHHHQQQQQAAHIVKIKINPDGDKNSRVISTVRLTLDDNDKHDREIEIENGNARERSVRRADCGAVMVSATNLVNERHRESAGTGDGCVTISVYSGDPPTSDSDRERNNNNNNINNSSNKRTGKNNSSISISGSNDKHNQEDDKIDNSDMVHRGTTDTLNSSSLGGRSSACFYYNSYQNPLSGMVMSSGQCSPSETLDSGTCSDLDGTPPPLPKKKNASTVILSAGTHNRTGSLTSSGAEVDSDDNESNISCDSLNGAEANDDTSEYRVHSQSEDHTETPLLRNIEKATTTSIVEKLEQNGADDRADESKDNVHLEQSAITETGSFSSANVSRSSSDISSLSKASSTPRVRSPDSIIEQQNGKAVVEECTYEERKQHEQERMECTDADQNRSSDHKYLYEDDRYYNFHVNELREKNSNGENGVAESDECFAGYKIHEKEAIRSAKGTVRGVKNRVRAGIATFLQTAASKAYIEREKGRVVLYMTSLGIVRETFTNCMKMKQILWTNMVKYEEADLFRDTDLQSELRDRTESEIVTLPQLFVDGQYIGDIDIVERLNESGELRRILEPYQCKDACAVCIYCGGFQRLLCPICHGSKRSVHRNEFTVEFVALKCAKCDVFGMIRCPYC